jgi:hypothetical protein
MTSRMRASTAVAHAFGTRRSLDERKRSPEPYLLAGGVA